MALGEIMVTHRSLMNAPVRQAGRDDAVIVVELPLHCRTGFTPTQRGEVEGLNA